MLSEIILKYIINRRIVLLTEGEEDKEGDKTDEGAPSQEGGAKDTEMTVEIDVPSPRPGIVWDIIKL